METEHRTQDMVARSIRARREARGMHQTQLAARARLHQTTVSKIEAGKTVPRPRTLDAIMTALDDPFCPACGQVI